MSSNFETDARLILSDAWGINIPRGFCDGMDADDAARLGVDFADILTCQAGPDHPDYWEAWDCILDAASATDDTGRVWRLYQDGDLWEIPEDCEIPDHF